MLKTMWNIMIFANAIASLLFYAVFSHCVGYPKGAKYFMAVATVVYQTLKVGHKKGWEYMPTHEMAERQLALLGMLQ